MPMQRSTLRQDADRAAGPAAHVNDGALLSPQDALNDRNDDRAASAKPPMPLLQAGMYGKDLIFHRFTTRSS